MSEQLDLGLTPPGADAVISDCGRYRYELTRRWDDRLFCLGTNLGGSPKHPLYVPSSRTPTPWEAP